jgi:hypothetical protein
MLPIDISSSLEMYRHCAQNQLVLIDTKFGDTACVSIIHSAMSLAALIRQERQAMIAYRVKLCHGTAAKWPLSSSGSSSSLSYIVTDGQSASSSWCWGPWTDFDFLCLTFTFFLLHVRRPLWQKDGSVVFSEITHWLESRRTHNHILLSLLRLPQPGEPGPRIYIPKE